MNSLIADSPIRLPARSSFWKGNDEWGTTRRRRPASPESTPHNTLIQAAHLARHIAETLIERPISVANTPFLMDNLRSLHAIQALLLTVVRRLSAPHRTESERLLQLLNETLREPSAQRLYELGRFVANELSIYTSVLRVPIKSRPLPRDVFRNREPGRVVAMIGPGIGIGDEIKLTHFIQQVRRRLGVSPANFEIYSFCPWIWMTLAPELTVEGLATAPLRAFDRLRELRADGTSSGVLVVFACFMRQNSLSCLAPFRQLYNGLELAVASGEIWVRLRGDPHEYIHCALDPHTPNYSRALAGLSEHLFPRRQREARPTTAYSVRPRQTIRLVLNPFTSKYSPLAPADWVQFLQCVQRGLPAGKNLLCKIVPGLTPSCREYAHRIQALSQQSEIGAGTVRLLDDGRPAVTHSNAIQEVHHALASADLLLTIDTYTAHLAAHMRLVSIALCLNRNVRFWDPAPHTFWLNMGEGYSPIATIIGAVTKLSTRDKNRGPLFDKFTKACRALMSLGHPTSLRERSGPKAGAALWQERADAVWAALPQRISRALLAIDADYAWPTLRGSFLDVKEKDSKIAMNRLADSCFFRMAWLGAGDETTEFRHR